MALERFFEDWNPMRELADLQRRINRTLEGTPVAQVERWLGARPYPPVNVYFTDADVVVAAEVAGMDPATLDITVAGGVLKLSGTRPLPAEEGISYYRRERRSGDFTRSVRLPEPVDNSKAEAHYQKGILTVVLPRAEESKLRKIKVKTEKPE